MRWTGLIAQARGRSPRSSEPGFFSPITASLGRRASRAAAWRVERADDLETAIEAALDACLEDRRAAFVEVEGDAAEERTVISEVSFEELLPGLRGCGVQGRCCRGWRLSSPDSLAAPPSPSSTFFQKSFRISF